MKFICYVFFFFSFIFAFYFLLGKATGIVTNTRITHATPAALYGHSPSRYWEDDSKVPPAARKSCKDLARQLIENDPGRHINVSPLLLFIYLNNPRNYYVPNC